MRDPQALRRGMTVQTPNGPGTIRSVRNAAGLWRYLVHDYWWTAAQITVPEPPPMPPAPVSVACMHDRCGVCRGFARDDDGGQSGTTVFCGCSCHRRQRPLDEPEVA